MPPGEPPASAVRRLLAGLVAELCPEAVLVEFDETPDGGFAFRAEIPGDVGKDVQISKRLLHAAFRDRGSLAAVRRILRANLLRLSTKRTASEARAIRPARLPRALMLGVVREVDPGRRTIVVGDVEVWVGRGLSLAGLAPGMVVTVTCREADGRREAIALRWRHAS
jgi:hypothetical protein